MRGPFSPPSPAPNRVRSSTNYVTCFQKPANAAAAKDGSSPAAAGESHANEESKMEVDSAPDGAAPEAGAAAAAAAAGAAAAASGAGAGAGASLAMPRGAAARPASGAATAGPNSEKYEWVKIPAPVVRHERLRLLCSVLRLEACSDSSFQVRRIPL